MPAPLRVVVAICLAFWGLVGTRYTGAGVEVGCWGFSAKWTARGEGRRGWGGAFMGFAAVLTGVRGGRRLSSEVAREIEPRGVQSEECASLSASKW